MKQLTTKLTSKGIAGSGLPNDYKKAIAEYIWNSFDAHASIVEINFDVDQLGYLNKLSISDNGEGIKIETLSETFGNFMVSMKTLSFSESYIKGKKGKGRFSFINFCDKAIWETIFLNKTDLLKYKIEIAANSLENYNINDAVISKEEQTGTKVHFENFTELSAELLDSEEFNLFLCNEFGWFLHLNKDHNYKISINNIELRYKDVVETTEQITYRVDEWDFKIDFIQWKYKFGDKYYSYFLNSEKKRKYSKPTSFNNKAIDFHHSIYVESNYFDPFVETQQDGPTLFNNTTQFDNAFKKLIKYLTEFIGEKEKNFIKEKKAIELIERFNTNNIFPDFRNNQYDKFRKQDLENVVKEIYSAQPKIFQDLNNIQSKTIVGFLNLLLDSEQRENLLTILDNIIKLSDIERADLAITLQKSKLTHITALIKFLENRFNVVEVLKTLIFELEKFTNERNHIQKIIEDNYWLFGEQYHIVSADKNFEALLNNYLEFLDSNNTKPKIETLTQNNKLIRPDIFICRKTDLPNANNPDSTIQENILVELKRPSIIIGSEQFQQIEKYLRFIIEEERFNSQTRIWKFILVGKSVDSYIIDQYENQKNKGKQFLVQSIRNYEIYAMTWDDIFRFFEIKHKHLIDKLEFKSSIIEELESKGITLDKETSNILTNEILKKV